VKDLRSQCNVALGTDEESSCNFNGETASTPPTPVPHILNTNEIPTVSERDLVYTALSDVHPSAQRLDAEIARALQALASLFSERQKLREFEHAHLALLSPMRRLPPEVIAEIFLRCIPPQPYILHARCAPLMLTGVCKRWRNIVLASPRLWSYVTLFAHAKTPATYTEGIRRWIMLSGASPLDLNLCCDYDVENAKAIVEIVAPTCERWRSLSLRMSVTDLQGLSAIKGRIPLLQSLNLNLGHNTPLPLLNETLSYFHDSPSLHFVSLSRPPTPGPVLLKLPWGQLTGLTIINYSNFTVLEILRQTPSVVTATFSVYGDMTNLGTTEVRLECLTSLYWSGSTELFALLTAPSLQELDVQPSYGFEETAWHLSFASLLTRSGCHLVKLTLRDIALSDEAFVRCMQGTPDLVDLHVITSGDSTLLSDAFLRQLACTGDSKGDAQLAVSHEPRLLPKLARINLSTNLSFSPSTLVEVITSRWNTCRLQRVELDIWNGPDDLAQVEANAFDALLPLVDEGFEFIMHWRW
jgi:hypothetical protein